MVQENGGENPFLIPLAEEIESYLILVTMKQLKFKN